MNSYDLSRNFWNWAFDNPEKVKPIHSAIYFFAIEHCNRLGWKKKFGFPSQMTMDAIGVKKWHTYSSAFNDLVEWGFIELVQKSKNQYSSNIICLVHAMPKKGEALDKAWTEHGAKQGTKQGQYNKTIEQETKKQIIKDAFETEDTWKEYQAKMHKTSVKEIETYLEGFIEMLSEEDLEHISTIKFKFNKWMKGENPKQTLNNNTGRVISL